jgi:uncharacterized protein YjbI with pentapeptide repeats
MTDKRGFSLRLIPKLVCACIASTATADIYQWHDGDGDGSLWLSSSLAVPFSNVSRQTLWWAELENENLSSINLSASNVSFAHLASTNLQNADLAFTLFVGADLHAANVSNANLFYADISDADLSGVASWESAFWLATRYNENTILPEGMNPEQYGMIFTEIPAPSGFLAFGTGIFCTKRRR